jgi:hypothetical protein
MRLPAKRAGTRDRRRQPSEFSEILALILVAVLGSYPNPAAAQGGRDGPQAADPPTPAEQRINADKLRVAKAFMKHHRADGTIEAFAPQIEALERRLNDGVPITGGVTSPRGHSGNGGITIQSHTADAYTYPAYQLQSNDYYCGPASAWAALAWKSAGNSYLGQSLTQGNLASSGWLNTILKLDHNRFFPDGMSYWDKQEDIHKNAHAAGANVHGGPAFIPWHRELCNRFEALLREVDSDLSLHYWDWTVDPRNAPDGAGGTVNLLQPNFMGGSGDPVGPPFADFESTEPGHSLIWRAVGATGANPDGTPAIPSDATVKNAPDFVDFDANIGGPHGTGHFYIGGSLTNAHFSFHDPIVFLLRSNLDRIWAEWQTDPAHPERLAPDTAYGGFSAEPSIVELIQPWAGDIGTGATPLRPWAPPDNMQLAKTYKDISVVTPRATTLCRLRFASLRLRTQARRFASQMCQRRRRRSVRRSSRFAPAMRSPCASASRRTCRSRCTTRSVA